ncbi:MAG TPA: secretin N-terminal domain-containing protein, partial [Pirellulaceae bacterium]|nr:secretin N-terminal domain-containing protein [Pirellulaceae bacterium]
IQRLLDVDSAKAEEAAPVEQPQLEIYSTAGADPQAVLAVMQTLMAGQQDVRLAVDPKTFNLVVLARPTQHATIRETLKQMQRDASEIEVFVLRRVDVQVATVAINKLFGGDEKGAANGAPKVESDPTSRQLIVRGTPAQITQVRSLLSKMGEGENLTSGGSTEPVDRGRLRSIPLTGKSAANALDQVELFWPMVRPNRIRVVRPSADKPTIRTSGDPPGGAAADERGATGAESTRGVPERTPDSGPIKQPVNTPGATRLFLPLSPTKKPAAPPAPAPGGEKPSTPPGAPAPGGAAPPATQEGQPGVGRPGPAPVRSTLFQPQAGNFMFASMTVASTEIEENEQDAPKPEQPAADAPKKKDAATKAANKAKRAKKKADAEAAEAAAEATKPTTKPTAETVKPTETSKPAGEKQAPATGGSPTSKDAAAPASD